MWLLVLEAGKSVIKMPASNEDLHVASSHDEGRRARESREEARAGLAFLTNPLSQ